MSTDLYQATLRYFQRKYPHWHIHSRFGRRLFTDSLPLTQEVISFDYVTLNGQRFYAERQSGNGAASLIEAKVSWSQQLAAGKLLDVFQFQQDAHHPPLWLAHVRWFKPWTGPREAIWDQL